MVGVLQFNVAPICIASNLVSGATDFILTKNGAQISSGAWNKQIGLLVASLCQTPPFRWLSCWLGFFLLDQTGRSAAGAPRSGTRDGSTTWATPIRKQTAACAGREGPKLGRAKLRIVDNYKTSYKKQLEFIDFHDPKALR